MSIPNLNRRRSSGLILASPNSEDEESLPTLSPLGQKKMDSISQNSAEPSPRPVDRSPEVSSDERIPEVTVPEGDTFNLGMSRVESIMGKKLETENPKTILTPPPVPQESESPFALKSEDVDGTCDVVTDVSCQSPHSKESDSQKKRSMHLEIQPSQKSSLTSRKPPPLLLEDEVVLNFVDKLRQKLGIGNELYRATLAEFFATGFLVFGGCCTNAQYVLSRTRNNEWIGVCVGWGLALLFAVQMAYRISGAHLNPAVSFFQLTQGKINGLRFILFVIAQNLGAFFGAMFTFFTYWDAIGSYDNGTRFVTGPKATAGIFGTYPAPHLSLLGGIFDQIVGTCTLCLLIACIVDRRNRIPPFLQPTFIGAVLIFIGMAVGMNAGYAINPARDFAPRLFTLIAGYGWRVFSYRDYKWFWVPIVAPMIGAAIGAWLYEFFIGFHIPDDPDTTYIHRIVDDRNPDGTLREIHLVENKPYSERPAELPSRTEQQTSYRNM